MQTCALCGVEERGLARVSGVDLCDACRFDPVARLAKRGITLDRKVQMHRNHNSGVTTFRVTDHWTLPRSTGTAAGFSRQAWVDNLFARFRNELTIGDPVFDDAVLVRTETVDRTRALLDEGTQSAILGLVASFGTVEIDGARVSVRRSGPSQADGTPDQGESAALLLHLLRNA